MSPVVKQFDNGWFIEREVTRRGKAYRQWFRIKDEGIIQAALEAERIASQADGPQPREGESVILEPATGKEPNLHSTGEYVPQEAVLRRNASSWVVERTTVISKVVEEVAGSYCRKVWWADKLELMQEAWMVVLAQLQKKPVPDEWLKGTVARIASRRMAQYLWELTSPATGARGGRHFQGVKRASELELMQQPANVPAPDARIVEVEAAEGVRQAREALYWRVQTLYIEALKRNRQEARELVFEAVLRVLVDGVQSSEAAAEAGAKIEDVYVETTRVKRLIERDQQARNLLGEIQEWRGDLV